MRERKGGDRCCIVAFILYACSEVQTRNGGYVNEVLDLMTVVTLVLKSHASLDFFIYPAILVLHPQNWAEISFQSKLKAYDLVKNFIYNFVCEAFFSIKT